MASDANEFLEETNIYVEQVMGNLPASATYLDEFKLQTFQAGSEAPWGGATLQQAIITIQPSYLNPTEAPRVPKYCCHTNDT